MAPITVLNVDDYDPGRYIRSRTLLKAGFDVLEASSGEEALQMARRGPELILLDINLPDINGLEVCRRLKENDDTAGIIVLHLSASRFGPQDQTLGLDNGADGYLVEPVSPEVLVATIRALLRVKRAETSLRAANRTLQSLTDMLSHELRQSLRSVTTFSQLLEQQLEGRLEPIEQEHLQRLRRGATQMQRIIDGALVYSTTSHETASISADQALEESLEELRQLIAESRAEVESSGLPWVGVGKQTLVRIFSNLISNAIKYRGDEPPKIEISAERDGSLLQFSVRDNGIGIDPRYHAKIFEMFERLHGGDHEGIGVGLALCKRLIEGAGGKIWVRSEPGTGSTFYFTLPPAVEPQDNPDGSATIAAT